MLVLMDRGFDAGEFLREVAATGAQFLARLTAIRRPPVLGHLPGGSELCLIGGVKVRVITAEVMVTWRLAATLLDHRTYPASALAALYHERWEHEITYLALRHTQLRGRALRSCDPEGLRQESGPCCPLPGAADRHHRRDPGPAGHRPRPASYQIAVQTAQTTLADARNVITGTADVAGKSAGPSWLPAPAAAAPRLCPPGQVTTIPLEQAPTRQPRTHQRITKITTSIHAMHQAGTTRSQQRVTTASGR